MTSGKPSAGRATTNKEPVLDITPATTFSEPQGGIVKLSQVVRALRRHVPLIVGLGVLGGIGGLWYAHSLPRTYTAYASLAIEGQQIAIPQLQGALRSDDLPDPMPIVRTEMQALTSQALLQDVVDKLGIAKNPEFNPALRQPTLPDRIKSALTSLLPHGPASSPAPGPDESVINAVEHALSTFQDNRSLVISLGFTSQDPRLAATFVNTLISEYLSQREGQRSHANAGANAALLTRIGQAKSELDGLEQKMSDLRSQSDIVAVRAGSVGQQQVEELATAAARASVARTELQADWNRVAELQKRGEIDALAGVLDSPTVARLRDQEAEASAKLASLQAHYGVNYPGVRSAAADLHAIRAQLGGESGRIVASLGAQLEAARQKESDLASQLAAARHSGVEAENANAQLAQLSKEADTRRALYQTLLQSEQQTEAEPADAHVAEIRVLSPAIAPGNPSGPKSKLITAMAGLTGLVFGCGIALLRQHEAGGAAGAADLLWATGLVVLETLPRRLIRHGIAARVLTAPSGPEARAMASLRERIRYAGRKGSPRSVQIVPPDAGRGHGELALAFARAAAGGGERVLLIALDGEAASAARLLEIRPESMMPLEQGMDWREVAIPDPASPLDVLLATGNGSGAAALLSGAMMENLLEEACSTYQLVVVASGHSASASSAAMASRVGLTVLVLEQRAGNEAAQVMSARFAKRPGAALAAVVLG
jgi:succinoglycan biosynthesis transport protein ExoP